MHNTQAAYWPIKKKGVFAHHWYLLNGHSKSYLTIHAESLVTTIQRNIAIIKGKSSSFELYVLISGDLTFQNLINYFDWSVNFNTGLYQQKHII